MVFGKVLFIVAETCSKFVSSMDKATSLLFADGAAALIVGAHQHIHNTFFNSYSDGSNADAIMIPDGGYRNPISAESLEVKVNAEGENRSKLQLHMKGADVFDFSLREIAPSMKISGIYLSLNKRISIGSSVIKLIK